MCHEKLKTEKVTPSQRCSVLFIEDTALGAEMVIQQDISERGSSMSRGQ